MIQNNLFIKQKKIHDFEIYPMVNIGEAVVGLDKLGGWD